MTQERYQQVKSAFRHAIEFPAEQREALLRRFCVRDPSLLPQVLELLATDSLSQTSLDEPAVGTQFGIRARLLSYTATRQ